MEVTQRAGQVLYIPEGWYHATVSSSALTLAVTQQPINAVPEGFYHHTILGTDAMKEKDFDRAIEHLRKALIILKDGNIFRKAGEAYEKAGNKRKAKDLYIRAIERNMRHPAAYVELIGMLIEELELEEADRYRYVYVH